ncbi:protein tesmin/TSO1-like CXC 2 isoform X2 [Carex rostrata]
MDAAVGSANSPLQARLLDLSKNTNQHEGLDCSPKKKRKKITDGTKSCNCRKSKCLKLYCECFANGLFCNENCGCSDCLNKYDQEEIILRSRQVIEGRNSHAFAPKVVLHATQPPKESVKSTTPIARHRIGCSCLKSLCIKKYCECFQAGVGCFSGCRCEGCQNKFGRKGGCGKLTKVELSKNIIGTERGTELSGPNIIIGSQEMRTEPSLNPLTPAIECSIILELLESIECMSPSIGLGDEPQEPRP